MIKIKNLTKKFGNTVSLDSVSLEFNINDHIALMGPNGAGKTTLIRLILGYYHANSGDVSINDLSPIENRVDILKKVSFVPQLPPPIKLSINELLHYICTSTNINKELIYHYCKEMELDITQILNKSFFKLSGGMKQKLLISVSLAKNSEIMIYDEPTANLDPKARDNFYRLLKQNDKEKIMLFVTHRLEEVKNITNRQIYFDLGKVISDEKF
ncbi:MAG: ABC transporter ATP-binding protein [Arcobacter sp.]|uniref:ABC transporter ATP-binding protein n=1 Tax=uncultured Arcobacter sp. TaxID=165434 RepID=UPI000CB2A117|nr:ABC transporter ATP-binding protein [uncultured Arcobacter sp.]PLY09497.1 MAG: ABC transporter ATP-binding protein [Arcobacter sp.]